jgi:hypothetical protein
MNFLNLHHHFQDQQQQWQLQKLLLILQILAVPQKNHHPHLEKGHSLSNTFGEWLIRKI